MRIIKQLIPTVFLLIASAVLFLIGWYLVKFISTHQPSNVNNQSASNQSANEASDDSSQLVSVPRVIGRVTVKYYSSSDESFAQTDSLIVHKDESDEITIQASIDSQGKTIRVPKHIFLRIVSTSKNNKYLSNRAFKIFSDEQSLFSNTSAVETSDVDKDKVVMVSLGQEVPYDVFVKMTQAQKVKMQVGPTTFELKESDVEAFRDLLKTIQS